MGKCFVDPNALLAVAGMLAAIAKGEPIGVAPEKPTFNRPCGCGRPTRFDVCLLIELRFHRRIYHPYT